MNDRAALLPNRRKITCEDGSTYYVTLEFADQPTVAGTILNKNNLLSDEAVTTLGLPQSDPVPSDAFIKIANDLSGKSSAQHATQHASGGTDVIAPADIGAAALENGVVKASQAKTLLEMQTASFTLQASQAEKMILTNSASAIVITLPLPSDLPVDHGTAFNFVRWASGAVSFAAGSGAYIRAPNNVVSISVQHASALAVKISDTEWWVVCG